MTNRQPQQLAWWWAVLGGMTLTLTGMTAAPGRAAERVYVSFSFLERSIAVRDLEIFATTGEITGDLVSYARFFKPEQMQQLRLGLQERIEIRPVAISQFLYNPVGKGLIRRVEKVVRTKSGYGSFYAIRAALILAAGDPEGLTALSILRHFPTRGVKVDLQAALAITKAVQQVVEETYEVVNAIASQSTAPPLALDGPGTALQQQGPYLWEHITRQLHDRSGKRLALAGKARKFPVDIYAPRPGQRDTYGVVVLSHGFNSNRSSYAYLAKHLASHGFVVVVPEHAGSTADRLERFLSGLDQDIMDPAEFVDRPLDVTHVLDDLAARSQIDPRIPQNLNLQQVGFIGHSFGGYTGLALTGQPLNFSQLPQACQQLQNTLNLSLLLQCQARPLPPITYDLIDNRIGALLTVSPIGSILLGPDHYRHIQIPTMVVSGSDDTVAPALPEQIRPFGKLTVRDRYLVLLKQGTHFSTTRTETDTNDALPDLTEDGPTPRLAQRYLSGLSTAFLQAHIEGQDTARAYLTPAYAAAISRPELPLHLTQSFTYNANAAR